MKRNYRRILGLRRPGFALIITLAALVFITVLILAFFSRALLNRQVAFSSTNMAKTDYLAHTSFDFIVGELRQEIRDGSTSLNGGNASYPVVYQPLTPTNAVPQKMGTNAPDTIGARTIAKVSASGSPIRPLGTNTASTVSISSPSQNARYLSPARWFGSGGPALGAQTNLPTWFFVTRNNGIKTPVVADAKNKNSGDYVVGRFACTVYDVSGLLNANAAGYPSVAATNAPFKSFTAYADLTALDSGFATNKVNNFVTWRNGATDTASAAAYETYLNGFAAPHGFLQTKQGHNAFLSRRDLLNSTNAGAGLTNAVVPYLTHFSRTLNAPSWGPSNVAGSTIAYGGTNANLATSVNRFTANVRYSAPATITHYKDDGTTETYQVVAGDSLLQRRFSLARLAWVTPSGPKPGMAQAVEDCFGLQWDSGKWRWEYVAGKNPPGVRIKTLEEAAGENREPNFFELLAAGILRGSVGQNPGKGMDANVAGGVGVYASQFDHYKNEANIHILTIGASIIDQYDTDSYPTAIHFDAFGLTGADDLAIQTGYGIENLPYLSGVFAISIADPIPPGGGANGTLKGWLQPQLWNPHQVPPSPLSNYPSSFRFYAYGGIYLTWAMNNTWPPNFAPITRYDDGFGTQATPGRPGEVYFNNPGDATSPFYNNPIPLTVNLTTSAGTPVVDQANTPTENRYDAAKWSALLGDPTPVNQFAGFSLTPDTQYNADPYSTSNTVNRVDRKNFLPDLISLFYASLQFLGPDNKYHPYNFMARITQDQDQRLKHMKASPEVNEKDAGGNTLFPASTVVGETRAGGWGPTRADPRTDRFSVSSQWWSQAQSKVRTMNPGNGTYIPPWGSGAGGNGAYAIPYQPGVFSYVPAYDPNGNPSEQGYIGLWAINNSSFVIPSGGNSGKNAYYSDGDGLVRLADGYRANFSTGDGCQLYLGTAAVSPTSSITNPGSGSAQFRRPVILNRPFRSIGELGFAYRDLPYKSLDLWSSTSADAGLLDLFAMIDGPVLGADTTNPGGAVAVVLQSLATGANISDALGKRISGTNAQTLAGTIVTTSSADPYANRADLATRLGPVVSGTGTVAFDTTVTAAATWANKAAAEAPMRALANVANTRTWNFLIDVIAQTGNFTLGASAINNGFMVQGERRYWLHVAIDRYTGEVVDQQLEPIYE